MFFGVIVLPMVFFVRDLQISVKLSTYERNYLDSEIKKGRFASYGHAFRSLLYFDKQSKRTIERLKSENAVLKSKLAELGVHYAGKKEA